MGFEDPELLEPLVHCFAKCFVCKKLVSIKRDEDDELVLEERKCPHCGTFLDEHQIEESFLLNLVHTSAITSSNKLQSLDLAVIPFLTVGLILLIVGFPTWFRVLNLLPYLTALIISLRWLYRYYYEIRFTDEEYLEAVGGVKKSATLWLVAHILNWTLLLIQPTFLPLT